MTERQIPANRVFLALAVAGALALFVVSPDLSNPLLTPHGESPPAVVPRDAPPVGATRAPLPRPARDAAASTGQAVVLLVGEGAQPSAADIEVALDGRFGQVDCLLVGCSPAYLADFLRCRDTAADVHRCSYRDDEYVAKHLPSWTCGLTDEVITLATQQELVLIGVTHFPPPADGQRRKIANELDKKATGEYYDQGRLTAMFGKPKDRARRIIAEPRCRTSLYPMRNALGADARIALDEAGLHVVEVARSSLYATD